MKNTKNTISQLKAEIKQLRHLINTQSKEISQLSSLSDYDFLTGIYNRHGFMREAEKFFKEFTDSKKRKERRAIFFKNFSIIFIDLDNLKIINDEYGHDAGDKAIKSSSDIFTNTVRNFDLVSRWGGDEFVVGLLGAGEKEALRIANKIRLKLKSIKIGNFNMSASFGVISADKNKNADILELIEMADKAMYEAKKNKGKDFVVAY